MLKFTHWGWKAFDNWTFTSCLANRYVLSIRVHFRCRKNYITCCSFL